MEEKQMTIQKFIKNNKISLLGILIFGLITYGIKLTTYSFSIDTEIFLINRQEMLRSWIGIGRYGLVLFKNIIDFAYINFYLANTVTFILLYLSIIICIYNIKIINNKNNIIANLLLGLIIITSPIFVEQFNFTLQCVEISFALLFLNLAFTIINKNIINNTKNFILILAILFLTFAFSCYQSFIPLMISLSTFFIILLYQEKNKIDIKIILKYLLVLIISIILYFIINKIILNFTHITASTYLSEQILWGKCDILKILLNIINNIKCIYTAEISKHFNIGLLLGTLIFLIYAIKKYKKIRLYLILIIFLISPFSLIILLGRYSATRSLFSIPYVTGLIALFMYTYIKNKKIKNLIVLLFSMIIIYQTTISIQLFYTDLNAFKQQKSIAQNIYTELNEKNIQTKPIIFVGRFSAYGEGIILKGETMGRTFFEWDNVIPISSNGRIIGFFNAIGYECKMATFEQFEEAKIIALKMSSYPEAGYIKEEKDYIIINLGN